MYLRENLVLNKINTFSLSAKHLVIKQWRYTTKFFCNILFDDLLQNQFFISGLSGDDTIKNRVLEALYRRILRAEREKKRFKAIIVIPLLPGFQVVFC
jgi:hypothetical protein